MSRIYVNFAKGTLSANLDIGGLTLNSADLPTYLPAISSPDELFLVIDPTGSPEIVKVTSYAGSGNTATIVRAQDGTSEQNHTSGKAWQSDITRDGMEGLQDGSLIEDDVILTRHINAQAVGQTELANASVGTTQLIDNAVTNVKMADNAVGTAEIQDGAVTSAKLDSGIPLSEGQVTSFHIADGTIVTADIQAGAIDSGAIGAAEITDYHISGSANIAQSKLNLSVTGSDIASNTITAGNIAANAVNSSEIADGAVDASHINTGQNFEFYSLTVQGGTGQIDMDGNQISCNSDFFITTTGSGDDLFIDAYDYVYIGNSSTTNGVRLRTNDVRLDDTTGGAGGQTMVRDTGTGRMYFLSSKREDKEKIKPLKDKALDVTQLEPSVFDYKQGKRMKSVDDGQVSKNSKQAIHSINAVGFIAEDAAAVDERFAVWGNDEEPIDIHWNTITTGLVHKVIELQERIDALEAA